MRPLRILVGHLAIEFGPKRIVLAPRRGDGRHFTFFLEPNPSGRHAGKFTPHITMPGGRRWTLARIHPERLKAFFDRVGRDAAEMWMAAMDPVDLQAMAADGWEVALPSDTEYAAWAERNLKDGERSYRWTERAAQSLSEITLDHLVPVTALDDDARRERQPFVAVRLAPDETLERCWLGHYSGLGWCRTSYDWLGEVDFMEIFFRHSKPGLWRAMLRMFDLLRIKGDREALSAALDRAERRDAKK